MDSHAVLRNNTERHHMPFTQFPPGVTPYKSVVQHVNQATDISITTTSYCTLYPHPLPSHSHLLINPWQPLTCPFQYFSHFKKNVTEIESHNT